MARSRLRLVCDDRDTHTLGTTTGGVAPESFKFPGGVREVLDRPDPRRMSADEVAALADLSIRQMQAQLDMLKHEAGGPELAGARWSAALAEDDAPDRAA